MEMAKEVSINVLTLNCWGIPYVSKNREPRMEAIAEKLAGGQYDVVCLQEVWSLNDFNVIRAATQEKLPHSHYFHSGVFGSGVCVLSRYPIKDAIFHKWPLNGYVHKIHHGDWFGGKGIGLCKIQAQEMAINVYSAHLHGEYNRENDEYAAHRVLQAFDTAQFIRMTSGGTDAAILGGDLNTQPEDLAYRIICQVAGLSDACSSSSTNLGTNECANNSYTSAKVARALPEGKRIDHILYLGSKNCKVEVLDFQHPFPKRVPYKDFSYSDHEAVMATFKLTHGESVPVSTDVRELLKEATTICNTALKSVRRQRFWYLLIGLILIIPLILTMGLDCASTSIGISIGLNLGRIFFTAILCYTLFMSSLWNSTERNALTAGCLAMELLSNQLNSQPPNE